MSKHRVFQFSQIEFIIIKGGRVYTANVQFSARIERTTIIGNIMLYVFEANSQ